MAEPRTSKDEGDRMLKLAERGTLGGTLSRSRPEGKRIPRPFQPQEPQKTEDDRSMPTPTPKSHMPKGATMTPRGDLGRYRQQEAQSAFPRRFEKMGECVVASRELPMSHPEVDNDDTPVWPRVSGKDKVV